MGFGGYMHLQDRITFHNQLILPAIPVILDAGIRLFYLWGAVSLYKIPDLVALLATNAFFALNVHSSIKDSLPSDPEYSDNAALARQQLMGIVICSFVFAGVESVQRAISDKIGPDIATWQEGAFSVFVLLFVAFCTYQIVKRHLSWASR